VNVLVFVNRYPSRADPATGAFVREMARAASRHAEVAVLCNDGGTRDHPRGHRLSDSEKDGLRIVRLSYRRPPGPLPHVHYRRGLRAAVRRLQETGFRPDVIHAHYFLAGAVAVRIGRRLSVPVVISEHSSTFPAGTVTGTHLRRARFAYRHAALVCPVSRHLQEAIEATGIEASFRIVPNTVDTEVFRPGPPSGGARIAYAAVLRPGKGLEELVRALRAVDAPWSLEVAGDGPARRGAERLAEELGIGERIHFHGALDRPALAELLRGCDLFALPSEAETQGVVLIEAMACGLPVVATEVGGVPEVVPADAGELVPPRDPDALAAALRRVIDGLNRFDRAAIARHAADRFGYEPVGRTLAEIYAELASPAPRSPA
jgi:glycosyltransferase involved in cell wall biosynthesis